MKQKRLSLIPASPATAPLVTPADLAAQLDRSPEAILAAAEADVRADVALILDLPLEHLPAKFARRLILAKATARLLTLDGTGAGEIALYDYRGALNDLELHLDEVTASPRKGRRTDA